MRLHLPGTCGGAELFRDGHQRGAAGGMVMVKSTATAVATTTMPSRPDAHWCHFA
jgi:hypothetical protein